MLRVGPYLGQNLPAALTLRAFGECDADSNTGHVGKAKRILRGLAVDKARCRSDRQFGKIKAGYRLPVGIVRPNLRMRLKARTDALCRPLEFQSTGYDTAHLAHHRPAFGERIVPPDSG